VVASRSMRTGRLLAVGLALACAGCTAKNSPAPNTPGSTARARTYGWTSVSLGALSGAVAIGTSAMMLHQNSVRSSDCDAQKQCTQAGLNANSQLSALSGWNAGAWVLTAAFLGVGAYLLLTNPPDEGYGGSTAITVGPGGAGLQGSF
jgi:hypothetical protein